MDKKSVSQWYSFAISIKTIIKLKSSFFKRRENIQIFHFWMENTLKMCNENWLFISSLTFFIHSFRSLIHSLHSKEERKKAVKMFLVFIIGDLIFDFISCKVCAIWRTHRTNFSFWKHNYDLNLCNIQKNTHFLYNSKL